MRLRLRADAKGPHRTSEPAWFTVETGHQFTITTAHFNQLQLSERRGLSPKTLERWHVIGTGPKLIRLPGKVIYRLCNIEAYENKCLMSSTAELCKAAKSPDQVATPTLG